MKRTRAGWGLVGSALVLLVSSTLWAGSYFTDRTTDHLQLNTSGATQDALHLLLRRGDFWLFDQFDTDATGAIRPLVVDPRTHVAPPILGIGRCTLPGFDLHYCRFAPDGYVEWSLRVSLWLPTALSLLGVAWFCRRIGRARTKVAPPGPEPDHFPA